MPQTFRPAAVLITKVLSIALLSALSIAIAAAWIRTPHREVEVEAENAQPIPFSHKHHVGDVGLDCRMCHTSVERTAFPGMPSAQLCLTCHSQLFADQALLAPLRRAAMLHQPIGWTHVDRLPDHVYFDHSVHLAKGVACVECHGRLDQMALVRRPHEMTMKWCIACHQNPAPHLRAPSEVFAMPPRARSTDQSLSHLGPMQLEQRQRLTDCSTCHR